MQQSSLKPGKMTYYATVDHHEFGKFAEAQKKLILDILNDAGGPMIELGCGSGNVLQCALEAGYPAWGIDLSSDMLEQAQNRFYPKYNEQLTLKLDDMRTADLPKAGIMTCMLNTFAGLPGREDRVATLRNVERTLKDQGKAIFAILNPIFGDRERENVYQTPLGEITLNVTHTVDKPQKMDSMVYRFYKEGVLVEEHIIPMCLISPEGFQTEIQEAGLKIEQIYGDLELSPFDPKTSVWQVYVLKK